MSHFQETPSFSGFNSPSRIEADIADLPVIGEIPPELNGAFYRVQPDHQFPPRLGDDITFNGDGMISRFHIHDGKCDFRQRWAKTDKWKLEKAAGKALFGAYRNPLTDDEAVKGRIRSTANTNAFIFGGKLWAMKEDSPSLIMDPVSMESFGFEKFGGRMTGETFTAHPKIDSISGNMVAIGYAASGLCTDDVTYMEVSPAGELVREIWFKVPYYCMMHDFGITQDYLLVHVVPIIGSWDRLEKGLPHFGFDRTMPVYLGVVPRRDDVKDSDIRWFKRDNCFASHVFNAFQEGTKIHFDVPEAQNNMFPFFPDVHGAPFDPVAAASRPTRWTVDLTSNGDAFDSVTRLSEAIGEFPRIDDRFAGQPYRYGWMLEVDPSKPVDTQVRSISGMMLNSLCLMDFQTGAEQHWWCGADCTLQEPCFIPREKDAPEGDGWIIQICNRVTLHRSEVLIFRALAIEEGPVARIDVPIRLRSGLHGNWAEAEDIGLIQLEHA